MKIEGPRPVMPAGGARRGAAASGFQPSVDGPQRPASATGAVGIASLDAILALQGEEPPAQRRARQAKRGRDALDALERLERGLLQGRAPMSLRADMESLQRASQATGDPGLDDVLREIDTRLAVEMAKLERMAAPA